MYLDLEAASGKMARDEMNILSDASGKTEGEGPF